ncbi:MAG TPA: RDD family protein [Candidatus Acidoferrum sp.]|nr:RDD family protein [Candidatus Acidoferrum sp.]
MYCSKCGVLMADGAMFCAACGQAFSTAAVMARPMNAQVATAPRVEYGGFWLRFLAYLVDGAVILIGICVVAIPLVFLTGLGAYLSNINPEQDWNENGAWAIIAVIFLLATASLVVTWLYHALMECSEWQATVGKKVLGLVVTDMEGRRLSFWRATGRHFAKIVTNMIPLLIGYILAGFTDKKQALHDMIAGCLILRRG